VQPIPEEALEQLEEWADVDVFPHSDRAIGRDEESEDAPLGRKLRDFAVLIAVIITLALPGFAVGVIQLARRGDLDPNTLWFSVVISVGAIAVVIVRRVPAIRREGWDSPAPKK
jgi:hypothetical protein